MPEYALANGPMERTLNRLRLNLMLLLAVVPLPAAAYLDPGTGSMMLQVILGGLAAVAVALKLYWYRILAFFGIRKKTPETEDSAAES